MTHHLVNILATLGADMAQFDPFPIEPMGGDQWLLASALQKSIRRAEIDTALQVGYALWQIDRQRFWRRLHIVAMEDVGVADTDALIKALIATAHPYWRRKMGDARVGLYLVRLLCRSIKTRLADSLFSQAEKCPRYAVQRHEYARMKPDDLAGIVTDTAAPLVERSLAIWFLAGTKKYPSDHLPVRAGDIDAVISALNELDVPEGLVESCLGVMSRTPWPLAIMAPLIWQYMESQRYEVVVHDDALTPVSSVGGIPLYAMDMFTRTGQASLRQWQKSVPDFKQFSVRQIGHAVFYAESHLLDRRLTSPAIDAFMEAGKMADMYGLGLDLPAYLTLRDLARDHMDTLQEIRADQLRRYLDEGAA